MVLEADMPIQGSGWELLITRVRQDKRNKSTRTVGKYQVFHNGAPVAALSGVVAESPGPGDNSKAGNKRRVEAGRYPLRTQAGKKYVTLDYTKNTNPAALPRPGLELANTNKRSEILIHPGRGFLWSVGCINPGKSLANAASNLEFVDSRTRAIALIDDLKAFLGQSFPKHNDRPIPTAFVLIDGEPG
jgi:hypothetical protein